MGETTGNKVPPHWSVQPEPGHHQLEEPALTSHGGKLFLERFLHSNQRISPHYYRLLSIFYLLSGLDPFFCQEKKHLKGKTQSEEIMNEEETGDMRKQEDYDDENANEKTAGLYLSYSSLYFSSCTRTGYRSQTPGARRQVLGAKSQMSGAM